MTLRELLEEFLEREQELEEQGAREIQGKLLVQVLKFMTLQGQLGLDGAQLHLTQIKLQIQDYGRLII